MIAKVVGEWTIGLSVVGILGVTCRALIRVGREWISRGADDRVNERAGMNAKLTEVLDLNRRQNEQLAKIIEVNRRQNDQLQKIELATEDLPARLSDPPRSQR